MRQRETGAGTRGPGARALVAILAAAFVLFISVGRSSAQEIPPPPDPDPTLELLAPTLSALCGNLVTVAGLLPLAGNLVIPGFEVPPEVSQALGPAFQLCGNVPTPKVFRECALETEILGALSEQLVGAGVPVPVSVAALYILVDQIAVLEAQSGQAALTQALDDALRCKIKGQAGAPAPSGRSPDDTPGGIATLPSPLPAALPGLTNTLGPLEPSATTEPAGTFVSAQSPRTVTHTFRYRAVFLVPGALLLVGLVLGRTMTAPVVVRKKDE